MYETIKLQHVVSANTIAAFMCCKEHNYIASKLRFRLCTAQPHINGQPLERQPIDRLKLSAGQNEAYMYI